MIADDSMCDSQTETRAVGLGGKKGVEDGGFGAWQSRPVVDDFDDSGWTWRLFDPKGALLSHHAVELDHADELSAAFEDLYDWVGFRSDPSAPIESERRWVEAVGRWIDEMGLSDDDFRCGAQPPGDKAARHALIRAGENPCQVHNNCSGKHAGFLMLSRHLGGDAEYLEIDHPVQIAVKAAFEEVTDEDSPGHAIDGCSAPNHACTLTGLARAMARWRWVQTLQSRFSWLTAGTCLFGRVEVSAKTGGAAPMSRHKARIAQSLVM